VEKAKMSHSFLRKVVKSARKNLANHMGFNLRRFKIAAPPPATIIEEPAVEQTPTPEPMTIQPPVLPPVQSTPPQPEISPEEEKRRNESELSKEMTLFVIHTLLNRVPVADTPQEWLSSEEWHILINAVTRVGRQIFPKNPKYGPNQRDPVQEVKVGKLSEYFTMGRPIPPIPEESLQMLTQQTQDLEKMTGEKYQGPQTLVQSALPEEMQQRLQGKKTKKKREEIKDEMLGSSVKTPEFAAYKKLIDTNPAFYEDVIQNAIRILVKMGVIKGGKTREKKNEQGKNKPYNVMPKNQRVDDWLIYSGAFLGMANALGEPRDILNRDPVSFFARYSNLLENDPSDPGYEYLKNDDLSGIIEGAKQQPWWPPGGLDDIRKDKTRELKKQWKSYLSQFRPQLAERYQLMTQNNHPRLKMPDRRVTFFANHPKLLINDPSDPGYEYLKNQDLSYILEGAKQQPFWTSGGMDDILGKTPGINPKFQKENLYNGWVNYLMQFKPQLLQRLRMMIEHGHPEFKKWAIRNIVSMAHMAFGKELKILSREEQYEMPTETGRSPGRLTPDDRERMLSLKNQQEDVVAPAAGPSPAAPVAPATVEPPSLTSNEPNVPPDMTPPPQEQEAEQAGMPTEMTNEESRPEVDIQKLEQRVAQYGPERGLNLFVKQDALAGYITPLNSMAKDIQMFFVDKSKEYQDQYRQFMSQKPPRFATPKEEEAWNTQRTKFLERISENDRFTEVYDAYNNAILDQIVRLYQTDPTPSRTVPGAIEYVLRNDQAAQTSPMRSKQKRIRGETGKLRISPEDVRTGRWMFTLSSLVGSNVFLEEIRDLGEKKQKIKQKMHGMYASYGFNIPTNDSEQHMLDSAVDAMLQDQQLVTKLEANPSDPRSMELTKDLVRRTLTQPMKVVNWYAGVGETDEAGNTVGPKSLEVGNAKAWVRDKTGMQEALVEAVSKYPPRVKDFMYGLLGFSTTTARYVRKMKEMDDKIEQARQRRANPTALASLESQRILLAKRIMLHKAFKQTIDKLSNIYVLRKASSKLKTASTGTAYFDSLVAQTVQEYHVIRAMCE